MMFQTISTTVYIFIICFNTVFIFCLMWIANQKWPEDAPTKDYSSPKPGSSVFELLTGKPSSEPSTHRGFVHRTIHQFLSYRLQLHTLHIILLFIRLKRSHFVLKNQSQYFSISISLEWCFRLLIEFSVFEFSLIRIWTTSAQSSFKKNR